MTWQLDLGMLALQEAEDGLLAADSDVHVPCNVDFVVHHRSWFASVIGARSESSGRYMAIVGEHFGDSLLYRVVGDGVGQLLGDRVEWYQGLIDEGRIWTLLGPEDQLRSVAGLKDIWEEAAGRGDGADSTTAAKTFRLGSASGK